MNYSIETSTTGGLRVYHKCIDFFPPLPPFPDVPDLVRPWEDDDESEDGSEEI